MKFTLSIPGSAAALAAAMAAAAEVDGLELGAPGNAGSTDTGIGTAQPTPAPSEPSGAASTQPAPTLPTLPVSTTTPVTQDGSDDEDEGDDTDGSGVDADGLPWDARIHSSSKKKTAKGVWVAVRGGPKGAEREAIEDELRGATAPPMPAVSEPAAVPPMPQVSEPVAQPSGPMPSPVSASAPAAETWDFGKLMGVIGPKIGSVITTDYLIAVCQKIGIGAITDTASKPEVIPQLIEQFKADGVW